MLIIIIISIIISELTGSADFPFSNRKTDSRKNYEEAEANAIGPEYVRADLLSSSDAARIHELMKECLNQRILFYEIRDEHQLARINAQTARLQNELWSVVEVAAAKQPTYPVGLVVAGMNDVLNSQGYTQAAWWYRLPDAAWAFMAGIAVFSTLLIGYAFHRRGVAVFLVLPLTVSISFFLIADIESPRHGLIRVVPQNLLALSESLRTQ
jgi:hypothetical protein